MTDSPEWEILGRYKIPGEPRPKARPTCIQGRRTPITPRATRDETERVAEFLRYVGPADPFVGDLAVILRFYRSNRLRVDVDNLAKLTLDAANEILWADDSQIFRLDAQKILGHPDPHTTIRVLRPTAMSSGRLL